jgi:hypothetical protein
MTVMADFAQIIGVAGTFIVLLAYALLTTGRLSNNDPRYPALNILGTSGILFSLRYEWNLPAVVTQVLWILIGIAALVRIYARRAR